MTAMRKKFFMIAGEASGDYLGGNLIAAIKRQNPHAEFRGVGGAHMAREGLQSLFPIAELSVMGFLELIPHIPKIWRRINQTVAAIEQWQPDAVVTVDSPGFNKRVIKKLGRPKGMKLIHYVAPSVWAWRPGRAKVMAKLFDHVLCLLPFEPPFFIEQGMRATFIGHPVIESDLDQGDGASFRRDHGISSAAPLLCLLPGSRMGEVKRLLPLFMDVYRALKIDDPQLVGVIPTLPHLESYIRQIADPSAIIVTDSSQKKHIFASCNVALAASGTVSVELARAGVPMVMAYKVNWISAILARLLVKIQYFTLTNILLNRPAIPEFFQNQANIATIAASVKLLLVDAQSRTKQIADARAALLMLTPQSGEKPSDIAARAVLVD